jgi:hypothetical protein
MKPYILIKAKEGFYPNEIRNLSKAITSLQEHVCYYDRTQNLSLFPEMLVVV